MKYYTLKNANKSLLYCVDIENGTAEKFTRAGWEFSESAMEAFGFDGGELLTPINELEAIQISKEIRGF